MMHGPWDLCQTCQVLTVLQCSSGHAPDQCMRRFKSLVICLPSWQDCGICCLLYRFCLACKDAHLLDLWDASLLDSLKLGCALGLFGRQGLLGCHRLLGRLWLCDRCDCWLGSRLRCCGLGCRRGCCWLCLCRGRLCCACTAHIIPRMMPV